MSDHFDGPRMIAEPVIDLTDLYGFPSPEKPGHLVLVMNVFPFAGNSAFFSDGAIYKVRLRRAQVRTTGQKPAFDIDDKEFSFTFTFAAPMKWNGSDQLVQEGTCSTPNGQTVSFQVNNQRTQAPGLRIYAGLRLDPFFADVTWVLRTTKHHQVASNDRAEDFINGANVLSIVLEVEVATLLGEGSPLFAIVAETWTAGKLPVRLARLGRPEIKNFTMSIPHADNINRDLEIRDLYNQEDAFSLAPFYLGAYRARINANLADWDRYDGKTDWQLNDDGNHPLTDFLLADFLTVDVSKPFSENSYFEIEQSMLNGVAHQTCGGRSLNDDIVDTMFTLYINAGNGERISDGIDQALERAGKVFPYLQEPNPVPPPLPDFDRLARLLNEP